MGFGNRECESKLLITGLTLDEANVMLRNLFEERTSKAIFGSSIDHYWRVRNGVFARARERDGIIQLTVKAVDRGTNLDRVEADLNCTSNIDTVIVHHNVFRRWNDVSGKERNSKSFYKEDMYFVSEDQIFAYKQENKWKPMKGFCNICILFLNGFKTLSKYIAKA